MFMIILLPHYLISVAAKIKHKTYSLDPCTSLWKSIYFILCPESYPEAFFGGGGRKGWKRVFFLCLPNHETAFFYFKQQIYSVYMGKEIVLLFSGHNFISFWKGFFAEQATWFFCHINSISFSDFLVIFVLQSCYKKVIWWKIC